MTLGGLALAVGILVDEATVEIENIHTQMGRAKSVARAVRLGNAQTAVPRLLAMLCILAVFIPSFFMQGAARIVCAACRWPSAFRCWPRTFCRALLCPWFQHGSCEVSVTPMLLSTRPAGSNAFGGCVITVLMEQLIQLRVAIVSRLSCHQCGFDCAARQSTGNGNLPACGYRPISFAAARPGRNVHRPH